MAWVQAPVSGMPLSPALQRRRPQLAGTNCELEVAELPRPQRHATLVLLANNMVVPNTLLIEGLSADRMAATIQRMLFPTSTAGPGADRSGCRFAGMPLRPAQAVRLALSSRT